MQRNPEMSLNLFEGIPIDNDTNLNWIYDFSEDLTDKTPLHFSSKCLKMFWSGLVNDEIIFPDIEGGNFSSTFIT